MKTIDYHGLTVIQAVTDLEGRVLAKEPVDMELQIITGHGKIREAVIEFLNKYEIVWMFDPFNKGSLRIEL